MTVTSTREAAADVDRSAMREPAELWHHRDEEHARAGLVPRFMPLARSLARRY